MEKPQYGLILSFSIVISLSLVSFVSCIVAEIKRSKWKDLKLDGKLCYLPHSHAFGYGIVALICLCIAQIIGNLVICRNFSSREKRNSCRGRIRTIATTLLVFSWISFGIAIILISAATSISREQAYGKGWLDGKCYVVKDGVFIGSAVLVILTLASTTGAAIITRRKTHVEQDRKVHAQSV